MKDQGKRLAVWQRTLLIFALITAMIIGGCSIVETDSQGKSEQNPPVADDKEADSADSNNTEVPELAAPVFSTADIPEYSGNAYVVVNDNKPYFSDDELTTTSFEMYSELDYLGRCGVASASIGTDIMPTEERGSIGQVRPTGWHTVKYDIVDGKYLYNRCHLIGYQLTGENANTSNLITGTRYMNIEGMLPFENMVADYVKETENHVRYRVTPVFEENNMLASGVLMEAKSVEDKGEGICFNVYVYNVQPGVRINYANGDSGLIENAGNTGSNTDSENAGNTDTNTDANKGSSGSMVWKSATGKKYHRVNDCGNMNPDKAIQITKEEAEAMGLSACSKCY